MKRAVEIHPKKSSRRQATAPILSPILKERPTPSKYFLWFSITEKGKLRIASVYPVSSVVITFDFATDPTKLYFPNAGPNLTAARRQRSRPQQDQDGRPARPLRIPETRIPAHLHPERQRHLPHQAPAQREKFRGPGAQNSGR